MYHASGSKYEYPGRSEEGDRKKPFTSTSAAIVTVKQRRMAEAILRLDTINRTTWRKTIQAALQPFYVGPPYFGPAIREEEVPKGLKLPRILKQDNIIEKPLTWLQDFFSSIEFAGGGPNYVVRYLPLYFIGLARQWLQDLPEKSIHNYMHTAFTTNFEGTYKRPHTTGDPVAKGRIIHEIFVQMFEDEKLRRKDQG
jgi:hypothetical protein